MVLPRPPAKAEAADRTGPLSRKTAAEVWLRYLATSPVRAVGKVTGRAYAFSAIAAVQNVDARDAVGLLDSGHFERVARS